jgi:ketosteroid isomerase-like protein
MTTALKQPQVAIRYFKAFAEKDIGSLDVLLADDVVLTDWQGQAIGKDAVLGVSSAIFNGCNKLGIDIEKIAVGQDTVMAELCINIDNVKVHVVDVLDYDQDNKIKRIRAYKR